jgi:two-component system cell cycle sensor histidine kinase/response regulator CckA
MIAKLEEQLFQSQKMEAIGRLAGGVAHDFNNILTIIKGNSDLALRKMDEENPFHERIKEIQVASNRATALTRQLLAFSRKQVLKPQTIDMNEIIRNMKKMLQRLIGEDIELILHLDSETGYIKADPSQMEQVIMNLVVNASDAMPQGGRVNIMTSSMYLNSSKNGNGSSPKRKYMALKISDTGTGMDKETQSHIFEPFFTTKAVGKGTGLGLATVYGIIKQSEGTITVNSQVGQGTTFNIYLPIISQIGSDLQQDESFSKELKQGRETILIVEDDDSVRDFASQILRDNGYNILVASNGHDALHICESHKQPIQLLLTDVIMPHMSGPELARHASKIRPYLKTLYMSGYTDERITNHGISDIPTQLVEKPFTAFTLTNQVREILDRQSIHPDLSKADPR